MKIDLRKPIAEMSEEEKAKFYEFIQILAEKWASKESLQLEFKTDSERQVRRQIELLRRKENIPYISHSKRRGYKIAKYLEDYPDAKKSSLEMHSRAEKILESAKPIDEFCRLCEEGKIKSREDISWQEKE